MVQEGPNNTVIGVNTVLANLQNQAKLVDGTVGSFDVIVKSIVKIKQSFIQSSVVINKVKYKKEEVVSNTEDIIVSP